MNIQPADVAARKEAKMKKLMKKLNDKGITTLEIIIPAAIIYGIIWLTQAAPHVEKVVEQGLR